VINNFDRGPIYSTKRGRRLRLSHTAPHISESCLSQQESTTTPKRTEQNLIVRIGMGPKSEAEVLDNKTVLEVLFR